MKDFREMLTLGRIRGMYNKSAFSNLSAEDLRGVCDYLDLLSDEIYQVKRTALRSLCETVAGRRDSVQTEKER